MNTTDPATTALLAPMIYSVFSIAKMELEPGQSTGFQPWLDDPEHHLDTNATCTLPNDLTTIHEAFPEDLVCQLGQMNVQPYRYLESTLVDTRDEAPRRLQTQGMLVLLEPVNGSSRRCQRLPPSRWSKASTVEDGLRLLPWKLPVPTHARRSTPPEVLRIRPAGTASPTTSSAGRAST